MSNFKLMPNIVTGLDLSRIIREAEKLDEFLYQAKIRSAGTSTQAMPKTTQTLEKLAEDNGLSLLNAEDRKHLIEELRQLKQTGKKVHISFAVEPSPAVIQKIADWMRSNIQKNLIIDIGIQPTISVGCVIRTDNKVFDMSLRQRFSGSNKLLADLLGDKK